MVKSMLMHLTQEYEQALYDLDTMLEDCQPGFPSENCYLSKIELDKLGKKLVKLIRTSEEAERTVILVHELELAQDLLRHGQRILNNYFYSNK